MSVLAHRLKERFFRDEHPYRIFEREVERYLRPGDALLDAGCGRAAPILTKYIGRAGRLIGVDLVEFERCMAPGVELFRNDLASIPLACGSIDLVMSRSVMEHVTDPAAVYKEMFRVLKPGGRFIFLTANLWDYSAVVAKVVPNRFHPWIVARTEGRAERDVFPVAYRTNTYAAVKKLAGQCGFAIASFRYLGQYPAYFMFSGLLFLLATGYEKLIAQIPALNFLQGWILVVLEKPLSAQSADQ